MPTECNPELFDFARVEGRAVMAAFDGGRITSDAGALLLGATDRVIGLTQRLAGCFTDARNPDLVEHAVETLVMQRIVGIALGYEDLIDHDELRHDPVMAVLAGKLAARRSDCAPLAGKSTLNRLELSRPQPTRYARLAADTAAIETFFVDLFLDAHKKAPAQITLDLDATDDPLHGHQEGRFFHGYYDCYCYLPLYVFCGRHLLAAKLRRADIDAAAGSADEIERIVRRIRARWPRVCILLVRGQPRRLPVRPRPQRPPGRRDRDRDGTRPRRERGERQAGPALPRFHLVDAGQLEPCPPRGRQGGVDGRRGQSALRRHLAEGRGG
jgi:hypothetical protein